MQKKLSQWATENPTEQRRELYNLLCNEVWLRAAHHKVNSNQGRETAGVDGETMSNFNGDLDGNLERLRQLLKAKVFEPQPVRRVYIPKADGKKRPLGIPGIRDRIVQEALRMILEPIWEADFSQYSYGFRPNRSTYDVISYLSNRLIGSSGESYQWVIEGDIASYFDTIPHRRLIKAVKKRVADRDIRELLWKFLRAGVMVRGDHRETLTGTPQGGIVSPLLANIYLHELDRYMESTYLSRSKDKRKTLRKQGKSNFLYVRYADDWVVLCNGTRAQALAMKEDLKQVLFQMGLRLSEEKTKVTHITNGFQFLGYWIERSQGAKGKMGLKIRIPQKAIRRFRYKVREITCYRSNNESANAKIAALNSLTRGWCQYYRLANNPSQVFHKLEYEIFWRMAHWLGRKYKSDMPAIMQRFNTGQSLGTKTRKLVKPEEFKARKRLTRIWYNPYTETSKVAQEKDRMKRESLFSYNDVWSGYEDRMGWMDLREEVIRLKGTVCALNLPDICESKGQPLHPSEVEIDHISPRAGFKDKKEADRMKHLHPVCTSCHRAKTKTDLKVLSRMR